MRRRTGRRDAGPNPGPPIGVVAAGGTLWQL